MVIFVVSVGFGSSDERGGDIDVVLFETSEQCKFAKSRIEEVTSRWGVGKGENRKQLPVSKSVECFDIPVKLQTESLEKIVAGIEIPQNNYQRFQDTPRVQTKPKQDNTEEYFEPRKHHRWND
jgi:hypothetical protein